MLFEALLLQVAICPWTLTGVFGNDVKGITQLVIILVVGVLESTIPIQLL